MKVELVPLSTLHGAQAVVGGVGEHAALLPLHGRHLGLGVGHRVGQVQRLVPLLGHLAREERCNIKEYLFLIVLL